MATNIPPYEPKAPDIIAAKGDTSPDGVGPRAHRDDGHREVEGADQDDADDDAAVEVPLRIPALFRHVGCVLVSQIGPHDERGRGADGSESVREDGRRGRGGKPRPRGGDWDRA